MRTNEQKSKELEQEGSREGRVDDGGQRCRTEDGGRGDKSTQKAIVRFGIFKQAA